MPRKYIPTTNRSNLITDDKLKNASRMITEENSSIRHAAEACGVDRMTLKRYLDKQKKGYEITSAAKRVFTDEEEKAVADHIKTLDSCFHGLSKEKCRKLAFDYAKSNKISTPANWMKDGMAGKCRHNS